MTLAVQDRNNLRKLVQTLSPTPTVTGPRPQQLSGKDGMTFSRSKKRFGCLRLFVVSRFRSWSIHAFAFASLSPPTQDSMRFCINFCPNKIDITSLEKKLVYLTQFQSLLISCRLPIRVTKRNTINSTNCTSYCCCNVLKSRFFIFIHITENISVQFWAGNKMEYRDISADLNNNSHFDKDPALYL